MIRLDKLLSHSGYGSRKEVKQLIRSGAVMVNGLTIKDDDMKVRVDDEIFVEGYQVDYQQDMYFMLNKPNGVVSATYDDSHQTVLDLVDEGKGLFPVGRLDIDTEGLLLICNDGKLCHALLSPRRNVDKKYYVEFDGLIDNDKVNKLCNGIILDDGYQCLDAVYQPLTVHSCHLTIREGKYHQVKRMFEAIELNVTYLKRISMGPLVLDEKLKPGEYRSLTEEEIKALKGI